VALSEGEPEPNGDWLAPPERVLKTKGADHAVERPGRDRARIRTDDDVIVLAVAVDVHRDVELGRGGIRRAVERIQREDHQLARRVELERLHADRAHVVAQLAGRLRALQAPRVEVGVSRRSPRRW
jgi:hypothetical protein